MSQCVSSMMNQEDANTNRSLQYRGGVHVVVKFLHVGHSNWKKQINHSFKYDMQEQETPMQEQETP